jgi:NAD+ synthase (glutamine-hydrolysing)
VQPTGNASFGFVRIAAASPSLRVADCSYNTQRILDMMARAEREDVAILVFPELCLTGYTCADLFHQPQLQHAARAALEEVTEQGGAVFSGVAVVGLPLVLRGQLFNCAAVLHRGTILGIVPKSFLPTYKEFYERRWFAPAMAAPAQEVTLCGTPIAFGNDLLFTAAEGEYLTIGVEICEDLWVPQPPSTRQALEGATVLVNLSASNEVIGKAAYRRQLVTSQSARCIAAYVYASCNVFESTTDVVFGGHCLIAENGGLLAESQRFTREEMLIVADIDLERLQGDRVRMGSFGDAFAFHKPPTPLRRIPFPLGLRPAPVCLAREIEAHPFVPRGEQDLRARCEEIFRMQVAGLGKRLLHLQKPPVAIGISGGLDSTLALLVACRTADWIGMERSRVHALTMPGFGTTERTRQNALSLMRQLGVSSRETDIRPLCFAELRALEHHPFGINLDGLTVEEFSERLRQLPSEARHDLVFENVQARMRMNLLMNTAFVIGTGDLSELALGWATYNGDHMSMYNPNVSIPKTLVRFLVAWAAENEFTGTARETLRKVVATTISPELLPPGRAGNILQATEALIGPYELHDFFLFHFLRYGAPPAKILYLATQARFDQPYTPAKIRHWLRVFLERFFAHQFKRSCLPDGPKVGSVSLSPRGDWRMPSDAQVAVWLKELDGY